MTGELLLSQTVGSVHNAIFLSSRSEWKLQLRWVQSQITSPCNRCFISIVCVGSVSWAQTPQAAAVVRHDVVILMDLFSFSSEWSHLPADRIQVISLLRAQFTNSRATMNMPIVDVCVYSILHIAPRIYMLKSRSALAVNANEMLILLQALSDPDLSGHFANSFSKASIFPCNGSAAAVKSASASSRLS